jgi:hypothetical protein
VPEAVPTPPKQLAADHVVASADRSLAGWLEVAEGGRARPGATVTLVARVRRPEAGTVRLASCTLEAAEGGRVTSKLTDR